MTAVNFPSSPSNGDTLTSGNTTYTYNSTKTRWDAVTTVNGIQLNSLSVSAEAAASGDGGIAYDNTSGEFTYTPPDLSTYLTSETDSQTLSLSGTTLSISGGNSADLSTLSGDSLPTQSGNTGKYLTTDGTDASWATVSAGAGYAIGDGLELNSVSAVSWPASPNLVATINGTTNQRAGRSIKVTDQYTAVGYQDYTKLTVHDSSTGALLRTFNNPDGLAAWGLYFDISGDNIALAHGVANKVFIHSVSTGSLLRTFTNPGNFNTFGSDVAMEGNVVAINSYGPTAGNYDGYLHVYNISTGELLWEKANPNTDGGTTDDAFRGGLAISTNYIIQGAGAADTGASNSGIVYILDKNTGDVVRTISPPSPAADQQFGVVCSVSGTTLAVGTNDSGLGLLYLFDILTGNLLATVSNPGAADYAVDAFGKHSFAIDGNYLAVGAQSQQLGAASGVGAVYLFDISDFNNITTVYTLRGISAEDNFGVRLDMFQGVLAVGAHLTGANNAGAAYIYNGTVSSTSYLQPDSTIATTAYVDTSVSNLVDSSPAALNTLNELAAALGDDANFSTTVTNSIAAKADSSATTSSLAAKAPLADPTFTGVPAAPTAAAGTNTTQLATTAFVAAANAAGGLPSQTDNTGKYLTTDGTDASWGTAPIPDKLTLSSTITSVYSTASVTPSPIVSHGSVTGWGLDSTYTIIGESTDKLHVYNSSNMSFIKTITLTGALDDIKHIAVANGKCLVAMPNENSNTGRVMLVDISSGSVLWNKTGSTANTLALLGRGEVSLTSTHAAIIHHEAEDGLGQGNVRIYDISGTELWNIAGTSGSTLNGTSLVLNSTHFAYSINPGASAQIVVRSLATGEVTSTIAAPVGADGSYLYVSGGASYSAMGMSETHIAATAYSQVLNVGGVDHKGVVHVWDLAGNITNTFVSPTAQANMGGTFFGQDGVKVEGDIVVTSQWRQDVGTAMPTATTSDALHFYSISADSHTHTATFSNSASTTTNQTWGRLVKYNEGVAGATMGGASPYHVQTFALGSSDSTTYEYLNAPTIATTSYVDTSVSNLVDSSPAALNTLNELAAALGDDANFSTTVTNSIATKAPLADPTFTGVPAAPTAAVGTNTTQLATTAFVTAAAGDSFPAQTDNSGKYLTTDGSTTSWAAVASGAGYEIGDGLELNSVSAVSWPASPNLVTTINGTAASKQLGFNIAASADYVVAGYYDHDRVEVYNARTGAFLRSIVCPNGSGKRFGKHGIDIDGTNLIVGAPGANKAYIFDITNGSTLQTFSSSSVEFGIHVSIKGNYAAVSDYHTSDSDWIGKLTVYNVTTGSQLYVVNNPNSGGGDSGDNFAKDGLDMTASYIVSAGWREDTGASGSGTAYVFDITNGALLATVLNPNPVSNGFFGYGIAADGDYLGVYGGVAGNSNVYVYSLSALVANASASPIYTVSNPSPDGNTGDNFGYASVSVAGTYMAVGAKAEDVGSGSSGSSYLYDLSDGTLLYSISGASGDDYMGTASAVGVGVFVTGSPQNDSGGSNNGSIGIYNGTVSTNDYLQPDSTIITVSTLKAEVAASADFAAFKARIAAL